ncbi:T9SS type A sorting domain-containing protein [Dyadobacter sandarakinus]|uniref:T9SS type A sorting domain-containing protein n=1 Tax=Dyadobacter sandarakinus TaxID=2747268 RepID=A0ABX7I249_9BACT|nr:T9SS type A sorting domain-containing protein [Dyadobacter sandarakinus]QRR00161.1 T9SS type A sorting domain-containing protein [Dyadobacter sandarakinus]
MKKILIQTFIVFCLGSLGSVLAQPSIKWQKSFGNGIGDCCGAAYPDKIIKTSDDNLVIASTASHENQSDKTEPGLNGRDPWIIKLNADGQKIWDKTLREADAVSNVAITETSDGGYVVCAGSKAGIGGDKTQNTQGGLDYWIIKLSASGNIEWDRTFGGSGDDTPGAVFQTNDGNFLVTGTSQSVAGGDKSAPNTAEANLWVVKFSPTGEKLWDKTFGGDGSFYGGLGVQANDGGYLVAGYSDAGSGGNGNLDFIAFKINPDGNLIWNKTYGGTGFEVLRHLYAVKDEGFILAGYSDSGIGGDKSDINRGAWDGWMIKISSTGTKRWDRTLGGTEEDEIYYVEQTQDGGYLAAVSSNSNAGYEKSENMKDEYPFSRDFWVVKLDANRKKVWDKSIFNDWEDQIRIATEISPGNYVVGGRCDNYNPYTPTTDRKAPGKGTSDMWFIGFSDTPNPQTLASFSVKKNGGTSALAWQTNADAYSTRFEVEHGVNSHWNHVFTVKSPGAGAHDYTFTHQLPVAGSNLYRLKMIDVYDNITYSAVGQLTFDSSEITPLNLPVLAWDKSLGNASPGHEGYPNFPTVRKTRDGNFIMIANATSEAEEDKSEAGTDNNPWIVKFTPEGTRIWDKTLTKNSTEPPFSSDIVPTADGGYLLCAQGRFSMAGNEVEPGKGGTDFWVVKLSANGSVVWDKLIGGPGEDIPHKIIQTADGGILVGGTSDSGIGGNKTSASKGSVDFWVVRLSPTGNVLWDATFGTSGADNLEALQQTEDGGFVLAGSSNGPADGDRSEAKGSFDFWGIKVNAGGALLWERSLGGSQSDVLNDMIVNRDGDILLMGLSYSPIGFDKTEDVIRTNYNDGWLVKLNDSGQVLWDQTLGGTDRDEIVYAEQTRDGGYLLTCASKSDSGFDKTENQKEYVDSDYRSDYWLVKVDGAGNKLWDKTIGGSGSDFPCFGTVMPNGSYFMIGSSQSDIVYQPGDRTVVRKGLQDIWMVSLSAEEPPLPVTLTSFTARKEAATTLLTWQTTSETRSDYFGIQHSLNGKTWEDIGKVNALGEIEGLHNYHFVHQNPANGNNYYRLKMMDTDASFTYSTMEQIKFEFGFEVSVYPNPAAESVHLDAPDWWKVKDVEVLNNQGKTLYKSVNKPINHIRLKAFETGMYFIKITLTDGTTTTRKLAIVQ